MTTATAEYSSSPRGILLGMLTVLLIGLTIAMAVVYNDHAVERHGIAEVTAIRNCFENGGQFMVWRDKRDHNKFFRICQLPDGRYGMQVVQDKIRECIERTCFIPKNGTYREVIEYLGRFATRWKGVVNW